MILSLNFRTEEIPIRALARKSTVTWNHDRNMAQHRRWNCRDINTRSATRKSIKRKRLPENRKNASCRAGPGSGRRQDPRFSILRRSIIGVLSRTTREIGRCKGTSRHFRASSTENTGILSRIRKMEMDYRRWITGSGWLSPRSKTKFIEISSERTILPERALTFDVHYPSFRYEEKYFRLDIGDRVMRKYIFAIATSRWSNLLN